jgi:hypothetical protein
MKIEFIADGSDDCPLIRLFDYTSNELNGLANLFHSLAEQSAPLSKQVDAEPVNGATLSCALASRDEPVVRRGGNSFELRLTADTWLTNAELTEALRSPGGFQWLVSGSSDIQVLVSPDGCW